MSDEKTKAQLNARMRRVSGQVAGIQRMVEDDRYCVDVLVQIAAARAALHKVGALLLESHVNTCVRHAFDSNDQEDRQAKLNELLVVFESYR